MSRIGWRTATVFLGLLVSSVVPAPAEVSVDVSESAVQVIVIGLTEGPDPWEAIWDPHRDIEADRILNAFGSVRGDGRPDIAKIDAQSTVVVWSYRSAGDHDIALSEWTGTQWSAPLFLTSETTDELDPRVLVTSNGNLHVTWWVKQTKKLYLATRLGHSNVWGLPREIEAPLGGSRPSLAEFGSKLNVAYERFSLVPEVEKEIVVARRSGAQSFDYVTVGVSHRSMAADPVIHARADIAWVDWKFSDELFAFAVFRDGLWGPPQTIPWSDPSWVGEEDARRGIRTIVLTEYGGQQDIHSSGIVRLHDQQPGRSQPLPYRETRVSE